MAWKKKEKKEKRKMARLSPDTGQVVLPWSYPSSQAQDQKDLVSSVLMQVERHVDNWPPRPRAHMLGGGEGCREHDAGGKSGALGGRLQHQEVGVKEAGV